MNKTIEKEIIKAEEKLRKAMISSDIKVLDELLSHALIFTNHLGHIMTKHDDIEAHKSKLYKIEEITFTEQKIKVFDDIVIVTVKARIIGTFKDDESVNNFRFTRVWNKTSSNKWEITVGHSSIVI